MTRRDGQLALRDIRGVEVGYWDPLRRTSRRGADTRLSRPLRNFGDLLGPLIVRELVRALALPHRVPDGGGAEPRVLAVGSIAHFGRAGDVLWGAGTNPKTSSPSPIALGLDVRAVRGPITRGLLAEHGVAAPPIFGDPALLLPAVLPRLAPTWGRALSVVPNLNELGRWRGTPHLLNPRAPLRTVLRTIADSRLVVGSSLHGIIVAEALGVPARAIRSPGEGQAKYADYLTATGRDADAEIAETLDEALGRGGAPAPEWDPLPLLRSFPVDLWGAVADDAVIVTLAARVLARLSRSTAGTR
jgi:pyruvyltransferase